MIENWTWSFCVRACMCVRLCRTIGNSVRELNLRAKNCFHVFCREKFDPPPLTLHIWIGGRGRISTPPLPTEKIWSVEPRLWMHSRPFTRCTRDMSSYVSVTSRKWPYVCLLCAYRRLPHSKRNWMLRKLCTRLTPSTMQVMRSRTRPAPITTRRVPQLLKLASSSSSRNTWDECGIKSRFSLKFRPVHLYVPESSLHCSHIDWNSKLYMWPHHPEPV